MIVLRMEPLCCDSPDPRFVHGVRASLLWCVNCQTALTTEDVNVVDAAHEKPRGNEPLADYRR